MPMTKKEIYNAICLLSLGNGLYSRIRRALEEGNEKDLDTRLEYLEGIGFEDSTDLVLYFEC